MLSTASKMHIKKRAKVNHIHIEDNYEHMLYEVMKMYCFEHQVIFSWLFDMGGNTLNACALLPNIILVNSEWAAHLVLFQKVATKHAFLLTIGHEETHKERDYVFWGFKSKDKKFVHWVNEIHADFGGTVKYLNGERTKAIEAINYKQTCKSIRDRDSYIHPSWNRRLMYISKYDFDEVLIQKVAHDVGCKNEKLIKNICRHYPILTLI